MTLTGRTLVPSLLLASAAYFFYHVHEVLLPFVLAAVIAYLFNPLIRFFEVRGLRRRPVVILLFVSIMSILTFSSYKLAMVAAAEAAKASHDMPMYVQKGSEMFAAWRAHT